MLKQCRHKKCEAQSINSVLRSKNSLEKGCEKGGCCKTVFLYLLRLSG